MRRLLFSATLIVIFGFAALVAPLVWNGLHDQIGNADVALVLGNKVNPDGTPSERLKARLDTAIALFKAGNYKLIIASGGTGVEGVPEGTAMKNYLSRNGIPEEAILVDNQGVDTFASARNTAAILKEKHLKSVFVISQYFHIPRCRLALQKFGISPIYSAHPSYFELRDLYSITREIPAYAKYFFREPTSG
jgi:vancomycin permeability regulator SanA